MYRESTLFIIGIITFFQSCTNDHDDKPIPTDDGSVNQWIEKQMRNMYYWYNEIPDNNKLNFNQEAEVFFTSLLSNKDGKDTNDSHFYYSYIETLDSKQFNSVILPQFTEEDK